MKIAIVEDLQFDFETLRDVLTSCLREQKVDCELCWFQTGEALLADFAPEQYDLFFLDLLLGDGMNGMDAARAVRRAECHAPIVFTTGEREYAVEGYEVQALDYLIKPYEPNRIQAVLTRVLSALRVRRYLTVPVGRDQKCICTDELIWAETRDHFIELHLTSGETVRVSQSFAELREALPPREQFPCCCRGILVNLEYVDSLQGGDLFLRGGQKAPVSRSKRGEMQKLLADYAIAKTRREMGL